MVGITRAWYAEVLTRLPNGARLLDVGIGTGGALMMHAELIRVRRLQIVGVDIDGDYLRRCRERIVKEGLEEHVRLVHRSIYDYDEKGFDAIYFGASFMLLPDPVGALRHVEGLLKPGGRVFFTQTFEEKRSPWMEKAKPMLHKLTTIHFGQVTYEGDFFRVLDQAGYRVLEHERIGGGTARSWRMVVSEPMARVA